MELYLKVKRVDGGQVPQWSGRGNAGLDLHSNEEISIRPNVIQIVGLGIATEFPETFVGLLRDRSGLGSRGLHVLAGVIDSSYRGEWKAALINLSKDNIFIKRFDRICQVVFVPRYQLQVIPTESLADSSRGSAGFGSSGI